MKRSCKNMHQKLVPDSFFLSVNNPSSHCIQGILLKIRFFERGLSKTPKKVTIFFPLNPFPFNGQSYQKQKRPGTSYQSLFRLQIKFAKISLLIMYYLTKLINIKCFLSYFRNYTCRFM